MPLPSSPPAAPAASSPNVDNLSPTPEGRADAASASDRPAASESPKAPDYKGTKHRYKAAGKEYEVEYENLLERASKAHGAEEKFSAAKKLEEETKARFARLKDPSNEDFTELVDLIGYDKAVKLAQKLVWEEIQWEELPEAERRAKLAEKKAAEAEAKLSEREKAEQEARQAQYENDAVDAIDREISAALAEARKEGIDPEDFPELVEYTVDTLMAYLESLEEDEKAGRRPSGEPPKPLDVIRQYKERFETNASGYLKRIPAERLRSMLTPEQLSALRKADLDDLYAPMQSKGRSSQPKDAPDKPLSPFDDSNDQRARKGRDQRKMKSDDWFKAQEKRLGG